MDIQLYKRIKKEINRLYTLEKIANYKYQEFPTSMQNFGSFKKMEVFAQKLYTKLRCYTYDQDELVTVDHKLWNKMLSSKSFKYDKIEKMKEKIIKKIFLELTANPTVPSGIKKFVQTEETKFRNQKSHKKASLSIHN